MPDDPLVVALLKEYAFEASITRPEVGEILGLRRGQIAGIHHRNANTIGSWPTLDQTRKKNRVCQFPLGTPGTEDFHLCGRPRTSHPLVCDAHKGVQWKPTK